MNLKFYFKIINFIKSLLKESFIIHVLYNTIIIYYYNYLRTNLKNVLLKILWIIKYIKYIKYIKRVKYKSFIGVCRKMRELV